MDENQNVLTGGCLCGKVRYRITGAPLRVAACHCRDCQKNTGSAFSMNAMFRESQVELSGDMAVYIMRGDSGGEVQRHFCPSCGSTVRSAAVATQGLFVLKAGTLDEPRRVVPTDDIFCASEVDTWMAPRRRHDRLPAADR